MANTKFITKTIIGEDLYYLKDKQVRDSIGQANGIATLDSEGKVISSQIPSGIGDVSSVVEQTGNITASQIAVALDNAGYELTDTTYNNNSAVSGGTDVSLCTTGEKYNWNTAYSNFDGLKLKSITQSAYNALVTAGTVDANTLYIING